MKGQSLLAVSIFVVVLSAVSDALAIGFEVDTPLDPFLGGFSKFKRHLVRRIKDLSSDENFLNASPADQIGMLLNQPLLIPPIFSDQPALQLTSQPPVTTQLPITPFGQRKFGFPQIPQSTLQQLDAQLASLTSQLQNQVNKRSTPYGNLYGPRQVPNVMQQLMTQPATFQQRFT